MYRPLVTLPGVLSQCEEVTDTAHLLSEWTMTPFFLAVAFGSVTLGLLPVLLPAADTFLHLAHFTLDSLIIPANPQLSKHLVLSNPGKGTFRGTNIFEGGKLSLLFIQSTPDVKGLAI